MERHPDMLEMRERFERVGASPPAQVVEGLLFIAAGYAAISGWVIGFNAASPALNIVILVTGLTLMVLTVGFAMSYGRTYGMAWVAPIMGIWLIVAPWAVRHTDRMTSLIVSNVIVGGCITLFGLALLLMAGATRHAGRRSRMVRGTTRSGSMR